MRLDAPFPWFGGKSRVAPLVWRAFGDVTNYVEPFFGSGAVLLGRPEGWRGLETVNDKDGFICNFWRAVQAAPDRVAEYADWPVNEDDLHARHIWLVNQREEISAKLAGDPYFYDVKVAGWWVWGISCWIGGGWCSGKGPWHSDKEGRLVHLGDAGQGVQRQIVHLGDAGQGVQRKIVHLGDAGQGVQRKIVHLGDTGQGVQRKIVGDDPHTSLRTWMAALAARFRRVRVCCGDWARVCTRTVTVRFGTTAIFLDPPYTNMSGRRMGLYHKDDGDVAHAVCDWAIAHGHDPHLRIALCGYDGDYNMPPDWTAIRWRAVGGYGNQGTGAGRANAAHEVVWCSPH
jgi:hypothetical protein